MHAHAGNSLVLTDASGRCGCLLVRDSLTSLNATTLCCCGVCVWHLWVLPAPCLSGHDHTMLLTVLGDLFACGRGTSGQVRCAPRLRVFARLSGCVVNTLGCSPLVYAPCGFGNGRQMDGVGGKDLTFWWVGVGCLEGGGGEEAQLYTTFGHMPACQLCALSSATAVLMPPGWSCVRMCVGFLYVCGFCMRAACALLIVSRMLLAGCACVCAALGCSWVLGCHPPWTIWLQWTRPAPWTCGE